MDLNNTPAAAAAPAEAPVTTKLANAKALVKAKHDFTYNAVEKVALNAVHEALEEVEAVLHGLTTLAAKGGSAVKPSHAAAIDTFVKSAAQAKE